MKNKLQNVLKLHHFPDESFIHETYYNRMAKLYGVSYDKISITINTIFIR